MEKNKPVKTLSLGCIEAAVWLNGNGKGNSWYSVTISRSYRVGEETRSTNSFRPGDLLPVVYVGVEAFLWIRRQRNHPRVEPVAQEEGL